MFSDGKQPIVILVAIMAKVINERCKLIKERNATFQPLQKNFALIAYRYLARRERGVYKLERDAALADARWSYREPPSLWDEEKNETWSNLIIALLAAGLSLVALYVLGAFLQAIPQLIQELYFSLKEPRSYYYISSLVIVFLFQALLPLILSRFKLVEVLAIGRLDWQLYQPWSTKQISSERQVILQMIGAQHGGSIDLTQVSDSDIDNAETAPAPIPPGIAEIVLSIDEEAMNKLMPICRCTESSNG
jgi:hypothetical protein